MTAPAVLRLPLPRWPFLWPLCLIPVYTLNGALNLARMWHGAPWEKVAGIGLLLGWALIGVSVSVGAMASSWRELRIEEGRLYLLPKIEGIPAWARWSWNPHTSRAFKEGHLEIDLAHASLEWVGRRLLLHGHPETDVNLGRGARAERVAEWLQAHGLARPLGR